MFLENKFLLYKKTVELSGAAPIDSPSKEKSATVF